MEYEIAKFVEESVQWLQAEQQGCCRYKLDDRLAIFVGWSAGYGDEIRDDVIQAKDQPDYAINVGIKVWTSDDIWTDFDFINFPYYENGETLDLSLSIEPNEDYELLGFLLLDWYNMFKHLTFSKDGKIIE